MRLSTSLPEASVPIAESLSGRKKIAVAEGLSHMRTLASVMEELDAQRDALISLHQHVRQRVSAAVETDFESYEERSIIQTMVEATGNRIDLTSLVQQELAGNHNVGEVITTLRARLEKQIARRSVKSSQLRSTRNSAGTSGRGPSEDVLSCWLHQPERKPTRIARQVSCSPRRSVPCQQVDHAEEGDGQHDDSKR